MITASVPEQQSSGRWRRFLRWLGAINRTHGEDSRTMLEPSKAAPNSSCIQSYGGLGDGAARGGEADQIFEQALADYREATKYEAGRPEGRVVPALVLGPQVYPDPSVWLPKIEHLSDDNEEFRKAFEVVGELDDLVTDKEEE